MTASEPPAKWGADSCGDDDMVCRVEEGRAAAARRRRILIIIEKIVVIVIAIHSNVTVIVIVIVIEGLSLCHPLVIINENR